MNFLEVKTVADSVSPDRSRLTTFECTYPRFVHSELMTHREFSRNASSSRAIPISKMIERVQFQPAVPQYWGKTQPGMQAAEEIENKALALTIWLEARDSAIHYAQKLHELKVHKQTVNRLLEPFSYIKVLISSTSWKHFLALRDHPDAQPEIQMLARLIKGHLANSIPVPLSINEWHLPYVTEEEKVTNTIEQQKAMSVARCARVSYYNTTGTLDMDKDLQLFKRLSESGHWSPFEHIATPMPGRWGNFEGWKQYRKEFANEYLSEDT